MSDRGVRSDGEDTGSYRMTGVAVLTTLTCPHNRWPPAPSCGLSEPVHRAGDSA